MTTPKEMAINPLLLGRWQSFALGALWLGFVIYAVLLSPPSQPDTLNVILHLSTGQWAQLNPMVVVLFNLMGVWPVVYASLAIADGRDQRVLAWPFVVGSFGVGAFALMPYLVLRKPTCDLPYRATETVLLKGLEHRLVGVGVAIATLLLIIYGFAQGDWYETWQDFLHQFATSQFIHVMSLDFCLLTLLTPSLLWDDIARRNLSPGWRAVSLVPLLGAAVYLALRPAAVAPQ
ncbi:hypothetical protein N836_04510 [Leptolyngbya sp. Heron Island J]|uniref:hypothetical protein n=1 Tax=Leptolyngbya sp. Heron Island J TaxID=1385935 RepID=UPI0003B98770|nr:hypothetical protein [Leptolyngbya sp. Heron Island J]ESA37076.1 hypothetical protein N836_04510 [Leptolyngbya sp. Heron Island J]